MGYVKTTQSQPEKSSTGKRWNNFSIKKKNDDSFLKNKQSKHSFTLLPNNCSPGHLSEKNKSTGPPKIDLYTLAALFVVAPNLETNVLQFVTG